MEFYIDIYNIFKWKIYHKQNIVKKKKMPKSRKLSATEVISSSLLYKKTTMGQERQTAQWKKLAKG